MRLERVGPWTMWMPNQQAKYLLWRSLAARLWRSLTQHRRLLLVELVAASAELQLERVGLTLLELVAASASSRLGYGLWRLELQLERVGLTRWRGRHGCGLVFQKSEGGNPPGLPSRHAPLVLLSLVEMSQAWRRLMVRLTWWQRRRFVVALSFARDCFWHSFRRRWLMYLTRL